jgi:hypothetical protein
LSTINSFDSFNIFELFDFLLTATLFQHLRLPRGLAPLLPWKEMQCFESIGEAVMWRITARSFTLEEVLIMAEMNRLAISATAPKCEKPRSVPTQVRP